MTRTVRPASRRAGRLVALSATRRRGSSRSPGAPKNRLRHVWPDRAHLVRPAAVPRAGPALRRSAHLSRVRSPSGRLPALWRREAGAPRLAGRQSALHQALCALRGQPVSGDVDQGSGGGRRSTRCAFPKCACRLTGFAGYVSTSTHSFCAREQLRSGCRDSHAVRVRNFNRMRGK